MESNTFTAAFSLDYIVVDTIFLLAGITIGVHLHIESWQSAKHKIMMNKTGQCNALEIGKEQR